MQPTEPPPPHNPGGARPGPDLLRKSATAPGDDSRILARLEHGDAAFAPSPSAQRRKGRIAAAAAVLALLAGALAWTFYQDAVPVLDIHSLPADVVARVPGAATSAARPAAPPQAAQEIPAEPAPAAIVDDRPPAAAPVAARDAPAPAPAPARAIKTPALAATPARPPAGAEKPGKPAAAASKGAPRTDPRADDGDVALLTALVAHANNQTVPAPANRDVVQAGDGETTEALLRRCQQLGLIEGMLCHSRICSGRWDSEPACK